ncbi:VOC family protein [Rubinisphaera sp.]|uniref:VOC family protein n=1 Tax=Rubinisphaera sp. TaxID=2024857 RepID=UPI000C0E3092|nr:VOC family protein [Rubinisphaera sp.]MBV11540.1 glyoxalase [Rubinisphaera sp.]HCS55705.1 glyoxalase [Planctomycetaceae bacterium]|tara:strand:+ start:1926 stop:2336 length:411 start_codon:yes stop_codon:yes gene_type:complete
MSVIQVEAIDHLTLVVSDLEVSRKFYVDLLGMEVVPRPNFSFKGSWFRAGNTLIHLILEHDQSGKAGTLSPAQTRSTRTHHFAFRVPDANAAWEDLEQSGIDYEVVSPPKFRPDGAVQIFLADPDGHVVELASDPQ